MPIIQYALPSKNKQLKKLLHFYWEVLPKHDDQGKLKQEMILVWCVATPPSNYHLRIDVCTLVTPLEMISYVPRLPVASCISCRRVDFQQHPNEYIRGATLRFLQKIKEPELLEPLIPTCRSCLVRTRGFNVPSICPHRVFSGQEHRHSYVRKNAVLAVYSIYRSFEHLIPDAPELMQTFLAAESDTTCKRNAFIFLANCATPKAVEWVLSVYDQILGFEDLMQLAVIDMIRRDCKGDTPNRVFPFA